MQRLNDVGHVPADTLHYCGVEHVADHSVHAVQTPLQTVVATLALYLLMLCKH